MVYFPVRKCYHIAKVSFLLILVVTIIALFEKWRGGKRAASASTDSLESQYEKEIQEDEARFISGLGEGGAPAYLTGSDKKKGEESEKKLAMNVYLSDRISYNRTLKDHRDPACARVVYDAELPSTSVILIFHNEPYSVVVRTIWSVINSCRRDQPWFKKAKYVDHNGKLMKLGYPGQDPSSPLVYLKEVILVDDNSTLPELKGKLSYYVKTRLPPDLIRILRLPDREGLMKARIRGARAARGDVLVFLDAHCEVETDWVRPLLQRVRDKRDAVITPVIDVLDQSTFRLDAAEVFQVGGFTFTGHFTWIDVPEREKQRRGSNIAPTWSPTMAGGLFAINRAYFWELGAYDEQMAGWGGENLEMSFRIWQCGGTLETVPCSRVGHVFRSFHPYSMPANSDTHGINTARMAEVWMDEYAELFYLHRPDLRNNPKIGDVTHRKILREKLQCKNFQWYLDNIYKEKFVPARDAYGYGRFKNPGTGLCIDTLQREGSDAPLGVYPCHSTLQATQHLSLSLNHELRDEDQCAQLQFNRQSPSESGRKVFMANCHGKQREQYWVYQPASKQIKHTQSGLCLDAGLEPGADLLAKPCSDAATQRWLIDYTEDNDFRISNGSEPTDQEVRLRRLRGQRRKSRSLLSYRDEKRHKHKGHRKRSRKRTKNKFILKLVRTLANGSEDHLEAAVYCRHRRLLPNNTFVRDLVAVLNDRNIKVINNGRVFERNKVTPLDPKEAEKVPAEVDGPVKSKKRSRQRKRKGAGHVTTVTSPTNPHEHDPPQEKEPRQGAGAGGAPSTPAARAHRIIIEDFVELAPTTEARAKRTRRRRHRYTTAAARERERDGDMLSLMSDKHAHVEEQIHTPPESEYPKEESMEDAAMQSAGEAAAARDAGARGDALRTGPGGGGGGGGGNEPLSFQDTDFDAMERGNTLLSDSDNDLDERWPVGESRFRTLESSKRRRIESKSTEHEDNAPDERAAPRASPAPVKVVMRTNLTFNLGEDFFKWRAKNKQSDADSELSIPRMTPPVPAWGPGDEGIKPPPAEADRRDDVTRSSPPQTEQEDDSSSSNSSD